MKKKQKNGTKNEWLSIPSSTELICEIEGTDKNYEKHYRSILNAIKNGRIKKWRPIGETGRVKEVNRVEILRYANEEFAKGGQPRLIFDLDDLTFEALKKTPFYWGAFDETKKTTETNTASISQNQTKSEKIATITGLREENVINDTEMAAMIKRVLNS